MQCRIKYAIIALTIHDQGGEPTMSTVLDTIAKRSSTRGYTTEALTKDEIEKPASLQNTFSFPHEVHHRCSRL